MIVVFYSFKGGVGRSMALANVAEVLAARGYNVLVIDWDLEAPGIESYFFEDERSLRDVEARPGLVDLLIEYKDALRGIQPRDISRSEPSANNMIQFGNLRLRRPSSYAVEIAPASAVPRPGRVSLITAGRRDGEFAETYAKFVQGLSWTDFYDNWAGGSYIELLRRDLQKVADIVLVDSRTGVTEHGGVCTNHLADAVVLLAAPNEQNFAGTLRMARVFSAEELQRARGNRILKVLPVAARVERAAERDSLMSFRRRFEDQFEPFLSPAIGSPERYFERTEIPYVPFYAFRELATAREPRGLRHRDLFQAIEILPSEAQREGRPRQLFISYHRGDRLWAERLVTHLRPLQQHMRLQVFWDMDVPAGSRWASALTDELTRADIVVPLVSAQYLASERCQRELASAVAAARAGPKRILPVLVSHCVWAASPVAEFRFEPLDHDGSVRPLTDWSDVDQPLTQIARFVRDQLDMPKPRTVPPVTSGSGGPAVARSKPVTLPRRLEDFIDREQELALIEKAILGAKASTVSITGMGGSGKTQLAVEVAYRLLSHFPDGVLFVDLRGSEDARVSSEEAMVTVIEALTPDSRAPTDSNRLASSYRALLAERCVLLVLDNAWDQRQVSPLLPPHPSAAIITSRRRIVLPGAASIHAYPVNTQEHQI
jgi:CO dehydrogenase nickel-insertion accessory protein CooC1